MKRPVAVILFCLFLGLTGCGPSRAEKDQVLQVLQLRAQALNSRDLKLYLKVVSPDYSDRGKHFQELRDSLNAGFKIYDSVSYRSEAQQVKIDGKQAEVTGKYRLKVVIRGKEMVLDGKEHLKLVKGADGWKITAGL